MTIGKRLIVLVAVPLVALLVFGMFARVRLSEIEERSRFVAETQLGSVTALGGLAASFAELRVSVRNTLLAADQSERAAARAAFDENDRTLSQLLQQYGASSISDERDRQLLGRFEDSNRPERAERWWREHLPALATVSSDGDSSSELRIQPVQ